MRRSADWMVLADDRILEYLKDAETEHSATTLHNTDEFDVARSTISKRLNKLADAELVDRLPNGVYRISDAGKAYLDERYDVSKGVYLNQDESKSADPDEWEEVSES